MPNSIKHLISQFNLQTKLFNNVTTGIKDSDATKQLSSDTNHIAWLTGHIVSTRYMLANSLGEQVKEPYPDLFSNGKGLQKDAKYPSITDLTREWNSVSEKIAGKLGSISEEALQSKMPFQFPTGDTLGDLISFLMHHEAYTIGQLGLSRRFFGYDAMKYN